MPGTLDIVYPEHLRRLGKEGTVRVEVIISAEGIPESARVALPLPGSELVDPVPEAFEDAAIAAVLGARFIPGTMNGVPVQTMARIPIAFRLTDPEPDPAEDRHRWRTRGN